MIGAQIEYIKYMDTHLSRHLFRRRCATGNCDYISDARGDEIAT